MKKHNVDSLQYKLKMIRIDAGKSQKEFAEALGISRSALANYETGKRHPDREILNRLATLFQSSVNFLTDAVPHREPCMHENNPTHNKTVTNLIKKHKTTLNIEHLATEYKISLIEFYDYMLSEHGQKTEENSSYSL